MPFSEKNSVTRVRQTARGHFLFHPNWSTPAGAGTPRQLQEKWYSVAKRQRYRNTEQKVWISVASLFAGWFLKKPLKNSGFLNQKLWEIDVCSFFTLWVAARCLLVVHPYTLRPSANVQIGASGIASAAGLKLLSLCVSDWVDLWGPDLLTQISEANGGPFVLELNSALKRHWH